MSNAAALLAHTHTSPGSPDRPPGSLGPCSEDSPEQRLQSTALCGCLRFIQANQKMFPCTEEQSVLCKGSPDGNTGEIKVPPLRCSSQSKHKGSACCGSVLPLSGG